MQMVAVVGISSLLWMTMFQVLDCNGMLFNSVEMTWNDARENCDSENRTLLYMSVRTIETLPNILDEQIVPHLQQTSEISFWTIHHASNQLNSTHTRYYGHFPTDDIPADHPPLLCVYAIYEVDKRRFGWEATECNDIERHYSFCRKTTTYDQEDLVSWVLYEEKASIDSAEEECFKIGGELLRDFEPDTGGLGLGLFFYDGLWSKTADGASVLTLQHHKVSLSSEWQEINILSRKPGLHDIAFGVMDVVKKSKSDASNKKYDIYFAKFKFWCRNFSLNFLPSKSETVSLYLNSLIQTRCSVAVLSSNFYAIKWYHNMHLFEDPCISSLVKLVFEGGKRVLAQPIQKKEPITSDIILKLFNLYKDNFILFNSRSFCMFLLAYAGFFRFNELVNIKMKHISFSDTHVEIYVEKSKTDIYRQGNTVFIAKTYKDTCPVSFLSFYCKLAHLSHKSDEFLFRPLQFNSSTHKNTLSKTNKPLSYTRSRELLLDAVASVGCDKGLFGLHSLRSGGATTAANNHVSDRLFKAHGRWRSENAKDGVHTVLTQFKSKEYVNGTPYAPFPEQTDETLNSSKCVYVIIRRGSYPPPPIEWSTEPCNIENRSFICEMKNDKPYLFRHPNMYQYGKSLSTDSNISPTECSLKCIGLRKRGYSCFAFNYNVTTSTCSYVCEGDYEDIGQSVGWEAYDIIRRTPVIGSTVRTTVDLSEAITTESTAMLRATMTQPLISKQTETYTDLFSSTEGWKNDSLVTEVLGSNLIDTARTSTTETLEEVAESVEITPEGVVLTVIQCFVGSVVSSLAMYQILQRLLGSYQIRHKSSEISPKDNEDFLEDQIQNGIENIIETMIKTPELHHAGTSVNIAPVSYKGKVNFSNITKKSPDMYNDGILLDVQVCY